MQQRERLESEFAKFHSSVRGLSACGYQVREEIENGYVITPPETEGEGILLTLMALTHGDEVAGLVVLNELLEFLQEGVVALRGGLALLLGNYAAALAGKRFLQRDLNRSFASQGEALEVQRARELTTVLKRTKHLIDFHQTTEPCMTSFTIFPFQRRSLALAQLVLREKPVVTRFSGCFSQDGMCSDEYVQEHGRVAITVELGQKGFDTEQIAQGVLVALRGLVSVNAELVCDEVAVPVYTFAQVINCPQDSEVELVEGLYNFQKVVRGEQLAVVDGQVVVAEQDGVVLFPKYKFARHHPPSELCHILRRVESKNLPLE